MSPRKMTCWAVMAAALSATTAMAAAPRAEKTATAPALVAEIKVLPDKAPDCSSLKSIVASITRECKHNDEKAVAIYNFMQLSHYHFAYPGEPGGLPVLKEINCYGWSLCGGLHSEESALWRQLGWGWRFVGWDGHTTVEANYDGQWHYLDAFLKFYAWKPDPGAPGGRTIAGEDELTSRSEELIRNAFVLDQARKCVYAKNNQFGRYGNKVYWLAPAFLSCGDELDGVIGGLKTHHRGGPDEGWAGIDHADHGYSAKVNLAPGFALTNTWDAQPDAWYWGDSKRPPAHTCGGHKDTRNDPGIGLVLEPYVTSKPARSYANGTLTFAPDFSSEGVLKSFSVAENVKYAGNVARARPKRQAGRGGGRSGQPVYLDQGQWRSDRRRCGRSLHRQRQDVQDGRPQGLHRRRPRPGGSAGQDPLQDCPDGAKARSRGAEQFRRLAVPFAGQEPGDGFRGRSQDAGRQPPRGHIRLSAGKPQQVVRADVRRRQGDRQGARRQMGRYGDLRAEDVRGKRLAGEVRDRLPHAQGPIPGLSANALRAPRGACAGPVAGVAARSRDDTPREGERRTGDAAQSVADRHATAAGRAREGHASAVLPVKKVAFVTKKGEVFKHQFVKWLKDNSDAWVMLVDFDAGKLPKLDDLASAKLVLYVEEAHDKAPMQVAAVMLDGPFAADQPYDFAQLGQNVGTTIVEKGTGAAFSPPRRYEIDVTRAVRAWAGGAKCHGLAVRIVPNRGVDDGWTVRFTPSREKPAELEIATYAEK